MAMRCMIDPKRFTRGLVPMREVELSEDFALRPETMNPKTGGASKAQKSGGLKTRKRRYVEVDPY